MKRLNADNDTDGSDKSDVGHKSRIQFKVQSLGVVELSSLLVHPPAVNATAEIALVYPILQNKQEDD